GSSADRLAPGTVGRSLGGETPAIIERADAEASLERAPHALLIAEAAIARDLLQGPVRGFERPARGLDAQRLDHAGRRASGLGGVGAGEGPGRHAGPLGQAFDLDVLGQMLTNPGMQPGEILVRPDLRL